MPSTDSRLPPINGAVRLEDWGTITARGPEAGAFLHGQLTQGMAQLPEDRARLAGYCSPKGRLIASFVAWKGAAEEWRLACSADLLAPTLKRLSMFVLRARCKLADGRDEIALYGVAGAAATPWLAEGAPTWSVTTRGEQQVIRLPDAAGVVRCLLAQPAALPAPSAAVLDLEAWNWLEVQSGVVRVVAATADQFVPQMANFEVVGGVDFQKGCYPGQEVVARSQYRGTLKRRTFLVTAPEALAAGADVFHSADPEQPAGKVALAAPAPDGGCAALVELKIAATQEPGELRCGAVPLHLGALPYALPLEAA